MRGKRLAFDLESFSMIPLGSKAQWKFRWLSDHAVQARVPSIVVYRSQKYLSQCSPFMKYVYIHIEFSEEGSAYPTLRTKWKDSLRLEDFESYSTISLGFLAQWNCHQPSDDAVQVQVKLIVVCHSWKNLSLCSAFIKIVPDICVSKNSISINKIDSIY